MSGMVTTIGKGKALPVNFKSVPNYLDKARTAVSCTAFSWDFSRFNGAHLKVGRSGVNHYNGALVSSK